MTKTTTYPDTENQSEYPFIHCGHCDRDITSRYMDETPSVDNDRAWKLLATLHDSDCDWVLSRGGQRDFRTWFVAINTFTPGHDGYGTVLSTHKSIEAAELSCRHAQPRERHSYLPTTVRVSHRQLHRGDIVRFTEMTDGREYVQGN